MAIQYIGNTISGVSGDTKPTLSANEKGVIFIETDTNKIYQWDTDSWNEIVLSDASTSAKGIASFSSDNFAASSGAITIKNGGVILGTETTGNYVATVAGTSNEVDVSASTGTVTIGLPNDVTIGQDLVVTRNLTVSGTTVTANVNNLTIEDPLLYLANGQSSSPAFDSGFVVERGNTTNVAFIWDESNDEFVTANVPANQVGETAGDVSLDSYAQLKTGKTIVRVHDTDNDVYPTIMMEKSANATVDNYSTVIADNERLGLLMFRGSNGSSMQTGAYIGARAAEDWDGNGLGTDIYFVNKANNSTSEQTVMTLASNGWLYFYGDRLQMGNAVSGGNQLVHIENTSNTSGANAQLDLAVGGASAGDPKILFGVEGVAAATWALGVDNSDSDKFVISANAALGTDNVLTLTDAGNVGIGDTPEVKLHVKGDNSTLRVQDSRATDSSSSYVDLYSGTHAGNTPAIGWSDDTLRFYSGEDRMVITTGGNVGINEPSPDTLLHITAAATTQQSPIAGTLLKLEDTGDTFIQLVGGSTSTTGIYFGHGSNAAGPNRGFIRYDNNDAYVEFGIQGAEEVILTNEGGLVLSKGTDRATIGAGIKFGSSLDTNLYRSAANTLKTDDGFHAVLGIGIDGGGPLGAGLNMETSTAGNYQIILRNTNAGAAAHAEIQMQTSGGDPFIDFFPSAATHWAVGADNSDDDKFKFSNNDTLGTNDRLVITTAGNVGIGETAPDELLHIKSSGTGAYLKIETSGTYGYIGYGGNTTLNMQSVGANDLTLMTNGTERIYIDSGGNVGIGTIAPETNLHLEEPDDTVGLPIFLMEGYGEYGAQIQFRARGHSYSAAGIGMRSGGTGVGDLVFYTNNNTNSANDGDGKTGMPERMRITSAGDVNIHGNIELGGNDIIDIGYTGSSWTTDKLSFKGQTTGTHEVHFWNTQTGNTAAHSRLQISTGNTTAGDSYIQFDNAGNPTFLVGLDTTAGLFAIANTNGTLGTNDALRISVATPPVVSFNTAHSTSYFDYVCDKCSRHQVEIFTCCGNVEWHDDVADFRAMSLSKESGMDYMEKVGVIQRGFNNDGEPEIFTTTNMMYFVGSMAVQNRQRMDAQYDEHENRFSGKIRKLEALLKKMLGDEKYTLLMDTID